MLLCVIHHICHTAYIIRHFEHVTLMKVPVIKKNYNYRSAILTILIKVSRLFRDLHLRVQVAARIYFAPIMVCANL